ncbi:MAG: DNA cytosine methyltransferase [Acinetobacter oleivorans]|nr:DNA cytosine methyltransferase [Acinetobacter oleivorans]
MNYPLKFYEFFCGGGMARAGLGSNWKCAFANDIDTTKGRSYVTNWGIDSLKVEDVSKIKIEDLNEDAELAWASFPCQDLSLAGMGAGLKGDRSGTFWPFWKIIIDLKKNNRAPKIVVLENVCGALTSHEGKDFIAICNALKKEDYTFGAIVIDAVKFLPQSRPRLFIIGVQTGLVDLSDVTTNSFDSNWHTDTLVEAYSSLSKSAQSAWVWWKLSLPEARTINLKDILEPNPRTVNWHTPEETQRLIELMSPVNLKKLELAQKKGTLEVGTIYRRTRKESDGVKRQRAEIRFDGIAGCLRTPGGGSSRQIIMIVEGENIRSRLLSSREAARLMGLPDSYKLPKNYNDSYHLLGDGLVVPVVSFLAKAILEPILSTLGKVKKAA